jgi:hypothetical protein
MGIMSPIGYIGVAGAMQGIEKQAESVARQRWWLMLFYVIGWFVWQLLMLRPVAELPIMKGLPVAGISLAGFVVWGVSLVLILRFMALMRRNRVLAGILNDELTVANRRRCWAAGYFALLFSLIPAVVAAAFQWIDALTLAQMLMMVAVSVPLLTFVWLERDSN